MHDEVWGLVDEVSDRSCMLPLRSTALGRKTRSRHVLRLKITSFMLTIMPIKQSTLKDEMQARRWRVGGGSRIMLLDLGWFLPHELLFDASFTRLPSAPFAASV